MVVFTFHKFEQKKLLSLVSFFPSYINNWYIKRASWKLTSQKNWFKNLFTLPSLELYGDSFFGKKAAMILK